jgi:hypothetical protein
MRLQRISLDFYSGYKGIAVPDSGTTLSGGLGWCVGDSELDSVDSVIDTAVDSAVDSLPGVLYA